MNDVLAPLWSEHVERLRVGIQPVDALGRSGPIGGLGLHLENVPRPWRIPPAPPGLEPDHIGLPGVRQSPTGRFAIRLDRLDTPSRLVIRITDPARRYVPRRLSIPVPGFQSVVDGDAAHDADVTVDIVNRATRPVLYPGAAYGLGAGVTVVRGGVRWADGAPVQWTRVRATTAAPIDVRHDDGTVTQVSPLLGRAHGDDRGEFLLVLGPVPRDVTPDGDPDEIEVAVEVLARPRPPDAAPVDSPAQGRDDPLWRLPVEVVGELLDVDSVATGTTTPVGYTSSVTTNITCRKGMATRPAVAFALPV